MSHYKRHYQLGGNYFFTLVTHGRRPLFADTQNINHIKTAINKVKTKHPFSLHAMVILPDHLHCLIKLAQNDNDFSTRLRLIKRHFSMLMVAPSNYRQEKDIWQRRFWEHIIRDRNDWAKHMDYIHYNPVIHGLALSPGDWKHSSFGFWVEKGFYSKNWGATEPISLTGMNENYE